ncbi:hypothetical protein AVEN_97094-1 [Araneus ventricosus]|uniref:Uncharacterized protein n=1 Tax=Araneus ventricosus TaxID=182803 RepID=A0A4Y2EFH2_ARAVE|nr:hypothetical protein AVEN_97094-1 [Araneus ventricosus]
MVRNYKPKSICGKVDGSLMKRAVEEVMKGRSVRQTSQHLAIDRRTLSRRNRRNQVGLSIEAGQLAAPGQYGHALEHPPLLMEPNSDLVLSRGEKWSLHPWVAHDF